MVLSIYRKVDDGVALIATSYQVQMAANTANAAAVGGCFVA